MLGVQAVRLQLKNVDDGVIAIGQLHESSMVTAMACVNKFARQDPISTLAIFFSIATE
jgi:hypothetical protein